MITVAKTLTAVIDGHASDVIYGTVAGERVGVGLVGRKMTEAMDCRIVAEGYVRVSDWTKRGPLHYTATIEAHPRRCDTCVNGCDCEGGSLGCEHAGCWGDVGVEVRNSCSGVQAITAA